MFSSTATQDREVPHCSVIKFRNVHAAASTFTVTGNHVICSLRHTIVSAFGLSALLPLLLHLLRGSVVDVGLALSKQLFSKFHYDRKMVASVGELVWMDLEHSNIFQDHLRRDKDMQKLVHKVTFLGIFLGIMTDNFQNSIFYLLSDLNTLPFQSPPFPSRGWCRQSA